MLGALQSILSASGEKRAKQAEGCRQILFCCFVLLNCWDVLRKGEDSSSTRRLAKLHCTRGLPLGNMSHYSTETDAEVQMKPVNALMEMRGMSFNVNRMEMMGMSSCSCSWWCSKARAAGVYSMILAPSGARGAR
eukprot:3945509-Amphidinium_carterae.1